MHFDQEKPKRNLATPTVSVPSMDWISVILELNRGFRKLVKRASAEGLYEVPEYDSVIAYQDYAWGGCARPKLMVMYKTFTSSARYTTAL